MKSSRLFLIVNVKKKLGVLIGFSYNQNNLFTIFLKQNAYSTG